VPVEDIKESLPKPGFIISEARMAVEAAALCLMHLANKLQDKSMASFVNCREWSEGD
jgi:hypothetical protein